MAQDADELLLGRLATHYKLVTAEQVTELLRVQAQQGGKLGELMVQRNLISAVQLEKLLKIQRDYIAKQEAKAAPKAPEPAPQAAPVARAIPVSRVEPTPQAAPVARAIPVSRVEPTPSVEPTVRAEPAPRVAPVARAAVAAGTRGGLTSYLEKAVASGASDLHVHAGAPIRMRIAGTFVDLGSAPLSRDESAALVHELLGERERTALDTKGQVDFAYAIAGVGRFRCNAYRQQRGTDCALRLIPPDPPTLQALGLPATLKSLTNYHQGMVLLTGPAGSGKSSTMAALVNIINEERHDHILTVEDPIEYIHPSKKCSVNQRQVGPHTESFARALRAALREDPDIISLGELRDLETISLALSAAETGHLVLATLHTSSTIRTVNRLLGVFPPEQQGQVRMMLSESLRAVVSQRLVTRADGKGRVPALEVLMVNRAVSNLIRENKTFQIRSILQTGASQGMGLLDGSLQELVKTGTITKEEAQRHAEEPARFK